MKVFLGNPPWKKPGFFGVRAGSRWPHFEKEGMEYMPFPFFLAQAAALIENLGHRILLVDALAENSDLTSFVETIGRFSPDLVLLEVSTSSIDTDFVTVAAIKTIAPTAKIALCGLHQPMYRASFLGEHPEIDFILFGEYEETLSDLVEALVENKSLEDIDGLIFRRAGKAIGNARRKPIADLDCLPWPARQYLPMYNYRDEPGNLERPSVQIWTSRGCPFRCVFCAWPQIMYGTNSYRTRSIKDVVDEIEWLIDQYGFQSFYIDDDTFNVKRSRVVDFCEELIRRRLDVPWGAMCRADLVDDRLLQVMHHAGLFSVKYGVESADQGILDKMGKNLDIKKAIESIRYTKRIGIKVHLTFIFGMPGETRQTAERTLKLAIDLHPESLQFTIATPFPGSVLYNNLKSKGKIESDDFADYDGFHSSVVSTEAMTRKEIQDFVAEANKRWRQVRYGTD